MIPYGRQDINQSDIDAVIEVLQSNFLTQGNEIDLFEEKLSNYCGVNFGVAVNSATSALHIACLALNLKSGDLIWTSPNSFVASANCALFCGAKVDFVDIDSKSYNMCVEQLEKKLIYAKKINRLPKILIPVHFAGQSCDMVKIHQLSIKYGFKVIEDASHAIGGKYMDLPIGNCKYSDITVFSFHPVKIITTGEGGMAMSNSEELTEKMKLFRSHGVTRDPKFMIKDKVKQYYYEQIELGFNYRMTELQAALGVSQIDRLDDFVSKRHKIKKRYDLMLKNEDLIQPYQHHDCYSSLHLYPIKINLTKNKNSRDKIFESLRSKGIGVNVHYIPIHTQPYFKNLGFKEGDFPISEDYFKSAISIPIFQSMTNDQQDKVIESLKKILKIYNN
jgi:UDP-4-amino-4,6-dideoxy-N-acetyl-beta-L-altrosamine transaminase